MAGGRWRAVLLACVALGCGGDSGGGGGGADDEVERSAVIAARVASCTFDSAEAFAALSMFFLDDTQRDCVVDAADCDAALACFGFRYSQMNNCPGGNSCLDTETLLSCRGNLSFEIDCSELSANGGEACFRGECAGAVCYEPAESCSGDIRIECTDKFVRQEFNCSILGMTCVVTGSGAECANLGGACADNPPDSCEGNTLHSCEGGTDHLTDCAALIPGGSCVNATCGYADECDVSLSGGDTCNGTALEFCLLGKSVSVDCTALGFNGCTSDTIATGCR